MIDPSDSLRMIDGKSRSKRRDGNNEIAFYAAVACEIGIEKSKIDKIGGGYNYCREIGYFYGNSCERIFSEARREKGILFHFIFNGGDFYENV